MRPGGGKQKGAGFERDCCRDLSIWISKGAAEDVFWRSAMSGGRATLMRRVGKAAAAIAGDITATRSIGNAFAMAFMVECKFYKDLRVDSLLTGMTTGIYSLWRTLVKEAKKHDKLPMMLARQNNFPQFVLLSKAGADKLKLNGHALSAYFALADCYLVWHEDFLKEAVPLLTMVGELRPRRILKLKYR